MTTQSDDLHLIERFKDGDNSAFEELILKYQDRIYNLCRHMLGNAHDAEDMAQDSFIKAYQNLKRFRPEASFYTWLYRIAVNTCLDFKKRPFFESLFRTSDKGEEFVLEPISEGPSPEKELETRQMMHALQKGLAQLSPKFRTVLILREMEGFSYEEIAEVLDLSTGTVKSRISRAREELKKSMTKFTEQKRN
ncbi:MAG: sigma-70 family RNA polymerase sigma factor [Nitrospirae bacterium]|nr:sigma-70 family RNA polymerase sigma factor [Nitrospirota bacterium]